MIQQENKTITNDFEEKEIKVVMQNKEVIEGVVHEVLNEKELIIEKDGNFENRIKVNIEDTIYLEVSEFPYSSFQHKIILREEKRAQFEFRYTKEQLDLLVGKYVILNYDGKIIEGNIIDCRFRKNEPNEIVVQSEDEMKVIEDFRLRSMEITGETQCQHELCKKMRELEEDLTFLLDESFNKEYVDFDYREVDPDTLLEKYFQAKLANLKGSKLPLEEFEYSWVQEVIKQKEDSQNSEFSSSDFYEDLKQARDLTDYYNDRKLFIDEIFKKVKEVNWSEFNLTQKNGQIEALDYIYDSGIITN